MKFFVPYTCLDGQDELIWHGIRDKLRRLGLATTRRRIYALRLSPGNEGHLLSVDTDTPDGEPVLLIFEAANADLYYVCTPNHGMLDGVPYILGVRGEQVIDFDEEVAGQV